MQLARTHFTGTNNSHLSELLQERHGIDPSRPAVRRILVRAGVGSPRRWRMPREGMLLQIDGNHYHWLGGKVPRFTLLLTVDDATGTVPASMSSKEEDILRYFLLMSSLIRGY